MAVTLHIPITHREYTRGNKAVRVRADTLGSALARLETLFPGLEGRITEGSGKLAPGMEVAVNGRFLFPFTPGLRVSDKDDIRISSIITGG